jgi:TetR/AcrR family transcriptional repressor of nem operon
MPTSPTADTAERILDLAQRLVQTRGYNAFSYADIASELGVKNAAIHYHFATKDLLGKELIARYRAAFLLRLQDIDRAVDAGRKLRDYAQIYIDVLKQDDRLCLCGMLAADLATLPRPMRDEVRRFFADNERWLASVLSAGKAAGQLRFAGSADAMASLVLDALEGGMLVSRCQGEVARFRRVVQQLFVLLEVGTAASA